MSPRRSQEPELLGGFKQRAKSWLHEKFGGSWAARIVSFGQFWELVFTGFINNRCPVRATALAFTTLLALIPMIAVAASISTGILKTQGREPIDRAIQKLVEALVPETSTNAAPPSETSSPGTG